MLQRPLPDEPEVSSGRRSHRPAWQLVWLVTIPLVLLCMAFSSGLTARVVAWLHPVFAVTEDLKAARSEKWARDPWGSSYGGLGLSSNPYSYGPNGVDEQGKGDDVLVRIDDATGAPPSLVWRLVRAEAFFFVVAIVLLSLAVSHFAITTGRGRRSGVLVVEIVKASVLIGPVVLATGFVLITSPRTSEKLDELGRALPMMLAVPGSVAFLGTLAFCLFALALTYRLTRPLEDEGEKA